MWLSDSPVDDADALEVTIEQIELVNAEGDVVIQDDQPGELPQHEFRILKPLPVRLRFQVKDGCVFSYRKSPRQCQVDE